MHVLQVYHRPLKRIRDLCKSALLLAHCSIFNLMSRLGLPWSKSLVLQGSSACLCHRKLSCLIRNLSLNLLVRLAVLIDHSQLLFRARLQPQETNRTILHQYWLKRPLWQVPAFLLWCLYQLNLLHPLIALFRLRCNNF